MSENSIFELVYWSIADECVEENTLTELASTSASNNAKIDVTGFLVFFKKTGKFAQILEGEKNKVLDLMKKIKIDRRHSSINTLWEGHKESRSFPQWNMAHAFAAHHSDSSEDQGVGHGLPDFSSALREASYTSRGIKCLKALEEEEIKSAKRH